MTAGSIRRYALSLWLTAAMAALVTLAGCSDSARSWNAKDISGLMPDLEFQLVNSEGEPVTAADSAGEIRLLFFGFTSCPDVCPTTLQKVTQATEGLPDPVRKDVQTLFVSVDPQRDTPERLQEYVNFFGDRIQGLTGTEPQLRELAKRYRTTFGYDEPDAEGNYMVSHSSAVYVFDRDGTARLLIRPDASAHEIREDLELLAAEG
ncbi:protein SCO1/2 [Marinobacter gudaonensis]|uniref:Protein SCO1/2 n=1 Tax=Marinobacter gudaonensis TaxID=375760 RepID=A0A1I6HVY1_9GAMM|nr:protein SCO1/2 [Marinobacter gudaonensis]